MIEQGILLTELRAALGGQVVFAHECNPKHYQPLLSRYYGRGNLRLVTEVKQLSHFKSAMVDEYVFSVESAPISKPDAEGYFVIEKETDFYAVMVDVQEDEGGNYKNFYTASKLMPDMRNNEDEKRAADIEVAQQTQPTPSIILP